MRVILSSLALLVGNMMTFANLTLAAKFPDKLELQRRLLTVDVDQLRSPEGENLLEPFYDTILSHADQDKDPLIVAELMMRGLTQVNTSYGKILSRQEGETSMDDVLTELHSVSCSYAAFDFADAIFLEQKDELEKIRGALIKREWAGL